jgi:hypothetical protein
VPAFAEASDQRGPDRRVVLDDQHVRHAAECTAAAVSQPGPAALVLQRSARLSPALALTEPARADDGRVSRGRYAMGWLALAVVTPAAAFAAFAAERSATPPWSTHCRPRR